MEGNGDEEVEQKAINYREIDYRWKEGVVGHKIGGCELSTRLKERMSTCWRMKN